METLELARQALLALTPFVAQGTPAGSGEATADRETQLARRAWNLLHGGAQDNAKLAHALEVYQEEPDDQRNLERLAQHLAAYLQQHQQVAANLRTVLGQLQPQDRPAGVQGSVTTSGTNYGQQAGVNYGTMTQHRQDIHNHTPNQGAQGSFHAPVTFNQGQHVVHQSGQQVHGDQYNAGRDIIRAQGNLTRIDGDYVGGDKIGGDKVQGDKISGDISVGDVSGSGIAIGHKAQAQVQPGGDQEAFARAFAQVYQAIKTRPSDPDVDRDEITETVKDIQEEARKGDAANEKKLTRWLHNLAGMAGDIFDVTVAALTGPQAAFATVARKVAERAKQEHQ